MQSERYYMLGERALVVVFSPPVSLGTQQKIWGLTQFLAQHPLVADLVPGMNNLTICLHQSPASQQQGLDLLAQWWAEAATLEITSRTLALPVVYGGVYGPDLVAVAVHCQLTTKQVIELHVTPLYTVYFIGFQPGFPYLAGLDVGLHCPRHAIPRQSVAAGSVGIADGQTGVYPIKSPGGWQLIGQTSVKLFTADSHNPMLLRPGDQLRFVPHKEGLC